MYRDTKEGTQDPHKDGSEHELVNMLIQFGKQVRVEISEGIETGGMVLLRV